MSRTAASQNLNARTAACSFFATTSSTAPSTREIRHRPSGRSSAANAQVAIDELITELTNHETSSLEQPQAAALKLVQPKPLKATLKTTRRRKAR